ncbi:glycoside hydrolase family 30 protein, partial [Polychaeton citri CBS 116435]
MIGFGHSWTDSAVHAFNTLRPDLLDQVMQDLFGQDGNNMGMMRHTIGSSDMSGEPYSYDDNGPSVNEGEPDLDLEHFALTKYGDAMAEMIARMGQYKGDVFLFGSPWSYPGWTKNNGLFVAPNLNHEGGGTYMLLNNSFNPRYTPQMVKYFSKYVDAFEKHGVTVNGMTPQNEPLNYQGGYPCSYLDAVDQANLISQGLGYEMHKRGVKIMAYDHNTNQPVYPARVLQGANGGMDAAAWHCYETPVANYSVMDDFHYAFPDVPQFMTECSNYMPQAGNLNLQVAQAFIPPVQHGASGANMWVMATDPDYGPHALDGGCDGCLGSIIVHNSTSYTKTADYYNIGQFSRFVRRGATNYKVISGNEGTALDWNQFWIVAFKNPDKSWAVVFLNNLDQDEHVRLSFTGSDYIWHGVIPNATLTTWLIPSDIRINGTHPPGQPSHSMPSGPGNYSATTGHHHSWTATHTTWSKHMSDPITPVPYTTHTIHTST